MAEEAKTEDKIVKPVFKTPPVEEKEEIVEEAEEEKEEETERKPSIAPDDYYLSSPLFHKVAEYFGLNMTQRELAKNKLSVIVDWAALEANSSDPVEILLTISQLAQRVGTPVFTGNKIGRVYRLVVLMAKKGKIEREMEVYTKKTKEEDK